MHNFYIASKDKLIRALGPSADARNLAIVKNSLHNFINEVLQVSAVDQG